MKRIIFEVPDDLEWIGWSFIRNKADVKISRQEDFWNDEIEDGMTIYVAPIIKDETQRKDTENSEHKAEDRRDA